MMPTTMRNYEFAYRREQRHYFEVEAATEAEARVKAEKYIAGLDLVAVDDQSDDPGEVEVEGWELVGLRDE
jgi:hypothetical protein